MTHFDEPPQDGVVVRLDYRYYPYRGAWDDNLLAFLRVLVGDGILWYSQDARLMEYSGGRVVRDAKL